MDMTAYTETLWDEDVSYAQTYYKARLKGCFQQATTFLNFLLHRKRLKREQSCQASGLLLVILRKGINSNEVGQRCVTRA